MGHLIRVIALLLVAFSAIGAGTVTNLFLTSSGRGTPVRVRIFPMSTPYVQTNSTTVGSQAIDVAAATNGSWSVTLLEGLYRFDLGTYGGSITGLVASGSWTNGLTAISTNLPGYIIPPVGTYATTEWVEDYVETNAPAMTNPISGYGITNAPYVETAEVVISDSTPSTDPLADLEANVVTAAEFRLSATNVYDDINFPIGLLDPPGAATPPAMSYTSGRDGSAMAAVFNDGDISQINAQMSHAWATGTTIFPHLHVEPQGNSPLTNLWSVWYSASDINGEFPTWTKVTNEIIIAGSQQWKHKLIGLPTNGISMTNLVGPSTIVKLRLHLITTSQDLHVHGFDIHYRIRGSQVGYTP